MISTKGRYALRVMIDLAEHREEKCVPLRTIADRQGISKKYLEIIVKELVRAGLIHGVSGKGGGYRLTRAPEEYPVGEILELTGEQYGLNEATLYTAFKRLEKNGYITSYWGDENSGARRRYYTVTEAGRVAYRENCLEWKNARDMLERLIGNGTD